MSIAISAYALCSIDDVADLLGYDDDMKDAHKRTIIRSINSASRAIPRRAQREFFIPEASREQTRYTLISLADVARGFVRVGDLAEMPTAVSILTPDRDASYDLDVDNDIWLLPDTPDPGFPFEFVKIKRTAAAQPVAGWWLSVDGTWGFPQIPDDIIQIAIGTSASWILNDVQKLAEQARATGRHITFESLIPGEFIDTVDEYRLYRVS